MCCQWKYITQKEGTEEVGHFEGKKEHMKEDSYTNNN